MQTEIRAIGTTFTVPTDLEYNPRFFSRRALYHETVIHMHLSEHYVHTIIFALRSPAALWRARLGRLQHLFFFAEQHGVDGRNSYVYWDLQLRLTDFLFSLACASKRSTSPAFSTYGRGPLARTYPLRVRFGKPSLD